MRPPTARERDELQDRFAAIESGHFAVLKPVGVMPQAGESFIWEQQCQYGQTQTVRTSRGSNPAMYVPLGHGVRMRLGGWQGASKNESNFAWVR
jgi:hypothetical protein